MSAQGATAATQAAQAAQIAAFKRRVMDPSAGQLVILDFWAEWCAPCKTLLPTLEKVAADYAARGVVLAKVNVDEERLVADQFQIRSIPTVYVVYQGKIVANLTNHRSEGEIGRILDQLLAKYAIAAATPAN